MTVTSLLNDYLGPMVTAALGWVGDVVDAIESTPILLMVVLMPFIGVGITLLRRLFKSKA